MIMYLKNCSEEYRQKNPVDVKYRKQHVQDYTGEDGPSEIKRDIVSEDGIVWYGTEDLEEGKMAQSTDLVSYANRLMVEAAPKQKGYRIMGYWCPRCKFYRSLPGKCDDCGKKVEKVKA